jgi:tetratricopeptide (TPR) repeat protein
MNFKKSRGLCLAFFISILQIGNISAQVEGISIVSAENYYLDKDYRNALSGYEQYLIGVKFDKLVAYKAGICATRLGIGKRGITHLLSARKAGLSDNYLPFWLGRAYHMDEQLDSADKYFNQYLDVFPIDKSYKKDAEKYINSIARAKEMFPKTLQPIVIENMGNGINSVYSEFHPLITYDGKMMVYTSRKKGYAEEKILDDGEYKEKIFSSRLLADGSWSKGIPIRLVEGRNKDLDYNVVQFIDNDSKLLLFKADQNGAKLFVSEYSNESWKLPYPIPIVPDPRFFTADIVFSNDLKTVFFTTNGNTNKFQNDIYTSHYDEKTEKWSEPVFLSKTLNSGQDEATPYFLDPKTLIFSSKKEDGFGDYDLYKTTFNESNKIWTEPENLGFPYNTPNNDFYFFRQPSNPDVNYFSSVRGTTKGQSDIYKVSKTTIAKGSGSIKDETGKPLSNVRIWFEDPENFQSIPVETDENGNFKSDLVAGQTYLVKFTSKEKINLEKEIKIDFPVNQNQLTNLQIQLQPKTIRTEEEESQTAPGE